MRILSLTRHRRTVLEVVRASKDHPTARQVFERAAKKDPDLSVATAYNSLHFLLEVGHICRVGSEQEGVRYDGVLTRHDHLVCRNCGRIDDVDLSIRIAAAKLPRFPRFRSEEISVRVTGLCFACQKKRKRILHNSKKPPNPKRRSSHEFPSPTSH